jgi:curli production assembly/transport component CsgG
MALISTAVTQGAEIWLIQALKKASKGEWFTVVERNALDNLLKERQIIRQTREVAGDENSSISPLLFAGVILEGGIVGYDTNTFTGGSGARALGVGLNTEIRKDTVTIGIRLVSVATGEILLALSSEKTILSTQISGDVFKFIDMGTKLIEMETGYTENESVTYAVRKAIEHAVLQLIKQGAEQNLWKIKERQGPPVAPCDADLPDVLKRDKCKEGEKT